MIGSDSSAVDLCLAIPKVPSSEVRAAALALLSDEERTQWRRFRRKMDADLYLGAHVLLRDRLSQRGALPPAAWRFMTNEYGRPSLITEQSCASDLRFNISHTKGLMAVGVVRGRDLGVDVECTAIPRKTDDVAAAVFSEMECDSLRRLAGDEKIARFFDYWTLKEAYIKARGMGLALPLSKFSFHVECTPGESTIECRDMAYSSPTISIDPDLSDHPERWHFFLAHATPSHRLAAAVSRLRPKEKIRINLSWEPDPFRCVAA